MWQLRIRCVRKESPVRSVLWLRAVPKSVAAVVVSDAEADPVVAADVAALPLTTAVNVARVTSSTHRVLFKVIHSAVQVAATPRLESAVLKLAEVSVEEPLGKDAKLPSIPVRPTRRVVVVRVLF